MRKSIAGLLVCAAVTFGNLHAQSASASIASLTAQQPERTKLQIGQDNVGELLAWRLNDPLSAYNGLTLVWMELDDDDVLLVVDPRSGTDSMTKGSLGNSSGDVIAVISGGMWSGAFDTASARSRSPSGLVYASGKASMTLSRFTGRDGKTETGGVLVSCDEREVSVIPTAQFRALTTNRAALPCDGDELSTASALQSNVLLGGPYTATISKSSAANRVAVGSFQKRSAIGTVQRTIVVAGAFNASGFALPLSDFSRFIDIRAASRSVSGLTLLNLQGDCGAQIYLPQIDRRYGCPKAGFLVNRILLRHSDGQ